jgi:cell division protein FtsQ
MNRKRWMVVAAIAAGGLVVASAAPGWLRQLEFFKVRRIEVLGARYLSGPEVAAVMKVPADASLFDGTAPYQKAVFQIRGVREVTVSRRWPGTLVVRLRESEPVALSPTSEGLALVDDRGWILPFDPTRVPADLPVAPADPAVAKALARIRNTAPGLYATIGSAAKAGDDVVIEAGGKRLLVRRDVTADAIRALVAVMDDLERHQRSYRELDARFTDRVFVRGMKT